MTKLGKGPRLPNSDGHWSAIRANGADERYYLQDAHVQPPRLSSRVSGKAQEREARGLRAAIGHSLTSRGALTLFD